MEKSTGQHRCTSPLDPLASRLLLGERFDWAQFAVSAQKRTTSLGHRTNKLSQTIQSRCPQDRLDLSNVSLLGHGLGGAAALAACGFSGDFARAVVMDGVTAPLDADVFDRVEQPVSRC